MPITKFTLSIVALLLTVITCNSQSSNDILVSGGFDLIKTDYNHFD